METLFADAAHCRKARFRWRTQPCLDVPLAIFYTRELMNGLDPKFLDALVFNMNIDGVRAYVRCIQPIAHDVPIDDYVMEIELQCTAQNLAEQMAFDRDVVKTVQARLRVWGVEYDIMPTPRQVTEPDNIIITFRFGDILTGGDRVCGETDGN